MKSVEEVICKEFLNGVDSRELGKVGKSFYYIISRYDDDIWWTITPMRGVDSSNYSLILDCRLHKGDLNKWKSNPYMYQTLMDSVMVEFVDFYNLKSESYTKVRCIYGYKV